MNLPSARDLIDYQNFDWNNYGSQSNLFEKLPGNGSQVSGNQSGSQVSGIQSGGIKNPIKYDDLMSFINALIDIIIQIGTPILVLAIVYVGFLFVQASGKPEKLNEAKQALIYTLIGAAIVLGAFLISGAIQGTVDSLK